MGKSDLMDRVAADLARGHTQPAIQRLHTMIADHPADLDLRRQLAAIYRVTGDAVEAGRWSYLDEGADPAELAAFELAFPAGRRRAALRWPSGTLAPTEFVRDRLAALPDDQRQRPATAQRPPAQPAGRAGAGPVWVRVSAATVVGALALVGVYAVVEWLAT